MGLCGSRLGRATAAYLAMGGNVHRLTHGVGSLVRDVFGVVEGLCSVEGFDTVVKNGEILLVAATAVGVLASDAHGECNSTAEYSSGCELDSSEV